MRPVPLALAAALGAGLLCTPALAQPAPQPTQPQAPTTTAATPKLPPPTRSVAKPTIPARKGPPRPYAACLHDARKAGLKGADRRRFVSRCELGYGVS